MKVTLLEHTPNPEKLIAGAAKLCYSSSDIDSLMDKQTPETIEKFLNRLTELGHESPLEHISFTFGIEGVSRIVEQQLTRHRIASYSIQSGRYVVRNNPDIIIPPSIELDADMRNVFLDTINKTTESYNYFVDNLTKKYINEGIKKSDAEKKAAEDARYIHPNGLATRIIVTMNARSLMNFFHHRCCERAQWEIRAVAKEMLIQAREAAPIIFFKSGANCSKGYCPEGKMQCSKMKGIIPTR